ncbi:MAG: hypothetical protein M0Z36_14130 [Thermaerobacter sp.]|nr:hypothetical protein [Thermaerobacter sp.]
MTPKHDPEKLLKAYWHSQLDEVKAPADLAQRVLRDARHTGAIRRESRVMAPLRILAGLGGVVAVVLIGALVLSHRGGFSSSSSAATAARPQASANTHQAASGAKSVVHRSPFAGQVAAFTPASNHRLWAAEFMAGAWWLWTRPSTEGRWRLITTIKGRSGRAQLWFAGPRGWLLVPARTGGWTAWHTGNDGQSWAPALLPPSSRESFAAVISNVGGAPVYLLLSSVNGHPSLYQRGTGGSWQRESVRGLAHVVEHLRIGASGTGYAIAEQTLYRTVNGGRSWAGAVPEMESAAPAFASAPTAYAVQVAKTDGLLSRVGSHSWMVYRHTLWVQRGPTWKRVAALPFRGSVVSLAFVTDSTGFVLSSSGRIYVTHDAGTSWLRAVP